MKGPIWGLTYNNKLDIILKPYDNTKWGLFEENSGIDIWFEHRHNFGNSMSNNHLLSGGIEFIDRDAKLVNGFNYDTQSFTYDTVSTFMPYPMSGTQFKIRLFHEWVVRRPHAINVLIPKQGYGMQIGVEHSNSAIYGIFDYTRISSDVFINYMPIKKLPVVIFARLKTLSVYVLLL